MANHINQYYTTVGIKYINNYNDPLLKVYSLFIAQDTLYYIYFTTWVVDCNNKL